MRRAPVVQSRRAVVKLGTRVLTHEDGRIALSRLFAVIEATAAAWRAGREVLIVSSGAVGLGRDALSLVGTPMDLPTRQACAAVGQVRLMSLYEAGFSRLGLRCAQVLLTQSDFDDRARYQHLRTALMAMLALGVVPIINENDVVATEELALAEGKIFGDNDKLSALVAARLGADLLILLTDVAGVYDRDPRQHPDARLIEQLDGAQAVEVGGSVSGAGRGGMRSKIEAANIATRSGCNAVIASGREPDVLSRLFAGENLGTFFTARQTLDSRRRWIAFATASRGALRVDAGAVRALRERGASLLAAGVTEVIGEFAAGDVVTVRGPGGELLGRGAAACDAEAARRWARGEAPEGLSNRHALIPRDELVLEEP